MTFVFYFAYFCIIFLLFFMDIKIYRFEPFTYENSIKDAVDLCKQYGFSHIPVVKNRIFRGMARCDDLINLENFEEFEHLIEKIYVSDQMTWTEILSIMMNNEANIVGVLDRGGNYMGIALLDDILEYLSEKAFISMKGYIITIKKNTSDFSVSQIAQIVESDGGKILGILVNNTNGETEVEIKIQTEDINEIIQTFRRYDYIIISQIDEDLHLQELKEHSAFLKRYLEIGE